VTFDVDVRGIPELKRALEDVKGKVKADVQRRASGYGARTVSGVRIRRRGTLVRVEQGARKTTGFHPSYGAFQQRNFFDPALDDNKDEVITLLLVAVDALAARV
jgi:hypothetical protein